MHVYSEESIAAMATAGAMELVAQATNAATRAGQNMASQMNANMAGKSIVTIANAGRVEPMTMVGQDVAILPESSDVLECLLMLYSGYYIQAIELHNTIGSVQIGQRLAPFNPNHRQHALLSFQTEGLARYRLQPRKELSAAVEAMREPASSSLVKSDRDFGKTYNEYPALAVGKMFKVTIRVDDQSVEVPIVLQVRPKVLPPSILELLFTHRDQFDTNLKERFNRFLEGELQFWKDIVFNQDLIAKYRKMAIVDKTGTAAALLRSEASIVKNLLSGGQPSVSRVTKLAVISSATLANVESTLGGKMSNSKISRAVFDATDLIMLAVVDPNFERVNFYTNGIEGSFSLAFRELKKKANGSGSDVMEIMKAFMMGSNPAY